MISITLRRICIFLKIVPLKEYQGLKNYSSNNEKNMSDLLHTFYGATFRSF